MKVKVPVVGTVNKVVRIDPDATNGATLGSNLYMPDGAVATPAQIKAYLGIEDTGTGGRAPTAHRLLTGLSLGDDHPQYVRKDTLTTRGDFYVRGASTVQRLPLGASGFYIASDGLDPEWRDFTEDAQDAIGAILTDSATIDLTYSDATPSITASVRLDQPFDWTAQHTFTVVPTVATVPVVLESREVTAGDGLVGGGDLSTDIEIALEPGILEATILTTDDETAALINSRRLEAGTNVSFDDTVAGVRTINVSGSGGGYPPQLGYAGI